MSEVKHEVLLQAKGIYKNFETSKKHPGAHPDPHAARNQGQRDL